MQVRGMGDELSEIKEWGMHEGREGGMGDELSEIILLGRLVLSTASTESSEHLFM